MSIGAELSGLIRVDGGAARVSAGVPGDRAVSDHVSVMPASTSRNRSSLALMIAERGAELVIVDVR